MEVSRGGVREGALPASVFNNITLPVDKKNRGYCVGVPSLGSGQIGSVGFTAPCSAWKTDRCLMYSTDQHLIFQGKTKVWGGYVWIW